MLSGLIPANLNQVTGVTSVDSHVRDLSINFLYLNQIVKHRLARIRFYLHERAVAAQLESVLNRNLPGFFSEQIFFSCVSARFFKTASTATSVTTDSAFFRTVGLKNLSFESLVGALSTTLFLFLEFKESPVFLNFFFVALRKIVEELVFLFGSRSFNFSFGGLQFKKVSVFILRRLFKFILTTRLSTYSFMILLVHAIREFVSHLPQITGAAIVSSELSAALALYTYKLRQLTAIPVPGSCASDRLNNIFLKNVVLGKDLLTSYAKHRGRGLRMFRRGRAFFSKKRRFNFIGRRPKYYFSKKKNNIFADEAETGFSFSNRLHCLRRALKFSSTSGQFTFLFF